ncbi:MAG: PqqD family protein [Acutalibacteraceae bacterium]|nr:PqqD family protein [Acutalibacteraceae bacterium]
MENKIYCLKGEYVLRQIAGEFLAVPISDKVGENANVVILNPVSQIIWGKLETGSTFNEILDEVMKEFNVEKEEAITDIKEFLNGLEHTGLLK